MSMLAMDEWLSHGHGEREPVDEHEPPWFVSKDQHEVSQAMRDEHVAELLTLEQLAALSPAALSAVARHLGAVPPLPPRATAAVAAVEEDLTPQALDNMNALLTGDTPPPASAAWARLEGRVPRAIRFLRVARSMAQSAGGFGAGPAWSPTPAALLRNALHQHDPAEFAPGDPDLAKDADARLRSLIEAHPADAVYVQTGSCAAVVANHRPVAENASWPCPQDECMDKAAAWYALSDEAQLALHNDRPALPPAPPAQVRSPRQPESPRPVSFALCQ